ncbi:MAG: OmpA family protein [Fibrobacteraceae bacterium]|nr:OmpA family protein [Fibrobacteraceae bacterium]
MKRVVMGMAVMLAAQAFAGHPQTINKSGFVGVNKTESAQSLGHSKLVFKALGDATLGNEMFPNGVTQTSYNGNGEHKGSITSTVDDYMAFNADVGFAIGIWHYFDLGITLPVHYDKFNAEGPVVDAEGNVQNDGANASISSTNIGYIGNLKADLKIRFPLPEDQPFDIAIFGGASFGTANAEKDGLWVRDAQFIKKDQDLYYKQEPAHVAQSYGTKSSVLKGGLGITADFSKLDGGDGVPFLLHVNGGYKYAMNTDILSMPYMSAAAEFYFMDFISIFAEYYWDIQLDNFEDPAESKLDMKQFTGALVFHLPVGLDIHLGGSYYLGGDNFVDVYAMENQERVLRYTTRVNPEWTVYGGLTWSGFLLAQDRDGDGVVDKEDKCPDDFGHRLNQGCPLGNPDADEDGVCDAWVAEKGFLDEFSDVCEGVDQCPNEPGEGDDGCPLDDPDPDKDGVCDAWVSQKKMSKKFKDICTGIDECPSQPGDPAFNGCPTKKPDPDGDGLCSPWVTDEGLGSEFADVCKGYDMCPGEAGPTANKGCPWDDPDSDGDGLCDEWVTQKKMGYYFEKADGSDPYITKTCKGLDKCPLEFGPASNDGCPLGDPDADKDGLCAPWVTEKNMMDQYDGICHGFDKCPNEAGEEWAQGCPMDDPDTDKDGVCDSWVTTKKMQEQFKDICTGVDKCPTDSGAVDNDGCPLGEPDTDKDGFCDPWVQQKGMAEKFKDVCTGSDRCPYEGGDLIDKFGCPIDDNPDTDGDGVCDAWVTQKGLSEKLASKCTGLDRCPMDFGDPKYNGCAAPKVEKLEGVTFQSGKAKLQNNAKKVLKGIAKKLTSDEAYKDLKLVIQGHTDNVGKAAKNQKLSEDRAKSVMNELVKAGVSKDRIKAVGCGSDAPVADNKTADGREENRRIEMHFVTEDDNGEKCEASFTE